MRARDKSQTGRRKLDFGKKKQKKKKIDPNMIKGNY